MCMCVCVYVYLVIFMKVIHAKAILAHLVLLHKRFIAKYSVFSSYAFYLIIDSLFIDNKYSLCIG